MLTVTYNGKQYTVPGAPSGVYIDIDAFILEAKTLEEEVSTLQKHVELVCTSRDNLFEENYKLRDELKQLLKAQEAGLDMVITVPEKLLRAEQLDALPKRVSDIEAAYEKLEKALELLDVRRLLRIVHHPALAGTLGYDEFVYP